MSEYKGLKEKICQICKVRPADTIDHIIPQWLADRAHFFGLEKPLKNIRPACGQCNHEKGGRIDYRNEKVSNFMERLIKKIEEQLYF